MTDRPGELLAAALDYAAHGWPVLPLRWAEGPGRCSCKDGDACGSPGKHPLTLNGLKDATTTPGVIGRWWSRWPLANIGLRTGVVADVLDADGPEGIAALASLAAEGRMPPTIWRISETGRGLHLVVPRTGAGNANGGRTPGWPAHLDYRGRDGYFVADPSQHHSGRRYRWRDGLDLPELGTIGALVQVGRMPWETAPEETSQPVVPIRRNSGDGTTTAYGRAVLDRVCAELRGAPEGSREVTMSQVAVMTAARAIDGGHLDRETAIAEIQAAAQAVGLSRGEVAKVDRVLSRISAVTHPIAPAAEPDLDELTRWVRGGDIKHAGGRLYRAIQRIASQPGADDAVRTLIRAAVAGGMPLALATRTAIRARQTPAQMEPAC